eukprot:8256694-Alexandrium_andersonii.AAC.1
MPCYAMQRHITPRHATPCTCVRARAHSHSRSERARTSLHVCTFAAARPQPHAYALRLEESHIVLARFLAPLQCRTIKNPKYAHCPPVCYGGFGPST